MNNRSRLALIVVLAFAAALGGAYLGRTFINPPQAVEFELHQLLHDQLHLDEGQRQRVDTIEAEFAGRRAALEREMKIANARLAAAIESEHGYGPKVQAAVDQSHRAMGDMQKATLEHIFAIRGVLAPDQAKRFDALVVKALTDKAQ